MYDLRLILLYKTVQYQIDNYDGKQGV